MPGKVLIFGAAGQLGTELLNEFRKRGYKTRGLDRASVDITDADRVQQSIADFDPEIVINAAAYNQVDVAEQEPQAAFAVNALAVRHIAMSCRQNGALLVHFSTDYVFDGRAGRPYTEEDPPRPLGAYAVSKLAGEYFAQAYLEDPLIIRTSGVYGPGGLRTARGNFIELMLRLAQSGQPIRVVEDHVASPTFAPALAARTADLVERGHRGLFHVGGGVAISWFDFAKLIFRAAGLSPELRPTNEREYRTAARRPRYSALSNAKMERAGLEPMPPLEQAVSAYFALRRQQMLTTAPA
ncbi:MAG: dTDP-4-dehydrorhamnose reductase [Bryobacterales bacterium]|nr:dTDP-4-dehydrorhamnose reductase [Bryobacteraceae bacterium]MDW8353205.1 dTDP-4-dehydrorhamnose reductase [Bryobacterales bacterium]